MYAHGVDAERARTLLAAERGRIEEDLRELASDQPTATDEQMADQGADLTEASLDEGLADELRDQLAAVERAEERLAAGTYGLSIESGAVIPDERLEAIPTAERTADEQAYFEGMR